MKKIIIIGATSGIGEALARLCIQQGYVVGGTGRRIERLENMEKELGGHFHFREMDVVEKMKASSQLLSLIKEMGGMDIIVLNAGISTSTASSDISREQEIIDVNVSGFVQLFEEAFQYFKKQGHGQIVGISSIAALLGWSGSAPYNASKAFISIYMQAYRQRCNKADYDITITDIKPGFVKSQITEGRSEIFWVAETEKAVRQILKDIEKKKSYSYVTRRWRLIAWLIKLTPNWVLDRI